jgi:pterin-4a-carbinolamine dehydratase
MSQVAQKQSPNTPETAKERLKSERVQEMLAAMPAWNLLPPEGEAISRVFQLPSSRVANAFAEYVSAYAEAAGHNVYLEISEEGVDLTLTGPKVRGRYVELTEEIVTFAQKFG